MDEMTTRRLTRPGRWTLRTRLVATQLALMAVVSLVIGLVSVFLLNQFLVDRLDKQLREASDRSVQFDPGRWAGGPRIVTGSELQPQAATGEDEPPGYPDDGRRPLPPGFGAGSLEARVTGDGAQRTAAGSVGTGDSYYGERLTAAQNAVIARFAATTGADRRIHVIDLEGELGEYRVIAAPGRKTGEILVTGLPMHGVYETIAKLTVIVVVVSLVGLVAIGLAGAELVRISLRPLRRVAATARRVAQLPLDRGEVALAVRVPEADTDDRTEVGQVGHALNRMLEHVASALQVRQDSEMRVRRFVSDASHELRTPLASIRGYAELTRRTRAEMTPDVAHALERVESEAKRMTDLVEELLLLARLDEGRPLDRALVDLSQLVVDAVSDAHVAGTGHEWRLDLPDEPVTVLGDQHRLHQVIANLLANAHTHTPPGTRVTAGLSVPGGTAEIRIADDGPGIPPELLPQVFDRFARADSSRSRTAGSTGLGLAIVQAVVRAHGGRVEVTSRPGETVFRVLLPLDDPAVEPAPILPPP